MLKTYQFKTHCS